MVDSLQAPAAVPASPIPAVNVASVPQRSPLRYPGGKTWLVPHVRDWLGRMQRPRLLVEPFAGGGIVSLTAVMEGFVDDCLLVERDPDVAAFWLAALHHGPELIERVLDFAPSREEVERLMLAEPRSVVDHGFRTLVLNRTRRGGVLAPGAALTRNGENGAGVSSRWYPLTLARRLQSICACAHRISIHEGDGIETIASITREEEGVVFFVDPPYTATGGKRAGSRLYAYNDVDHASLFSLLDGGAADFLMTYDRSPQVEELIARHGFSAVEVLMKNGHHNVLPELVITRSPVFREELPRG